MTAPQSWTTLQQAKDPAVPGFEPFIPLCPLLVTLLTRDWLRLYSFQPTMFQHILEEQGDIGEPADAETRSAYTDETQLH